MYMYTSTSRLSTTTSLLNETNEFSLVLKIVPYIYPISTRKRGEKKATSKKCTEWEGGGEEGTFGDDCDKENFEIKNKKLIKLIQLVENDPFHN